MANEEHLTILKQGVEVWNKWREENPSIRPDLNSANLYGKSLSGVNLIGANLSSADLNGANLCEGNLSGADLRNAYSPKVDLVCANLFGAKLNGINLKGALLFKSDLRMTNFSGADLRGADLRKANLSGADLRGADFHNANLKEACLQYTDLSQADLRNADLCSVDLSYACLSVTNLNQADLTQAKVGYTEFKYVDLSAAKGLETLTHHGPSTIGIDTIYCSNGRIPDAFLKGAGVPDDMIGYIHSIAGAIQFYSCFISYSSKDQNFAERLHADLQTKGVRCWFAPEDLKIGDKLRTRIDEFIRIYDKLVVILSENSIASDWVEKEVETAFEKERDLKTTALFPIRLDDAVMNSKLGWAADIKRSRHIGDFSNWKDHDSYQKAFDRLLRDLKAENGKAAVAK